MAHNQRNYGTEYKVQAVKLSQEIGPAKAASELGVCVDTLYGSTKPPRRAGWTLPPSHTLETAMGLAEELAALGIVQKLIYIFLVMFYNLVFDT